MPEFMLGHWWWQWQRKVLQRRRLILSEGHHIQGHRYVYMYARAMSVCDLIWSECAFPCPDVNLSIPSPKALKCHGYTMLCHDANILASFQYYFDSGIILSHLTDRVRSMDRLSGRRRTITAVWQKDSATSQQCILHRWSCHVGFRQYLCPFHRTIHIWIRSRCSKWGAICASIWDS